MDNRAGGYVEERLSTLESKVAQLQQAMERLGAVAAIANPPEDIQERARADTHGEPRSVVYRVRVAPVAEIAPVGEQPDTSEPTVTEVSQGAEPAHSPSKARTPAIRPMSRAARLGARPRSLLSIVRSTEYLLNKVGIVLFLFGVIFLFKYAVDKDLVSEQGRLALGLVLGTVLLATGLALHGRRRHFSQVLMGGGIATHYTTGYASYQLFPDLGISFEWAFGFMALVTLLALALSVRQDKPVLGLIGLVGGLLTPFVLTSPSMSLPWLMGYTCLLLTGTSTIYLFRGWRSLLWASLYGSCVVLLYAFFAESWHTGVSLDDRWALQVGAAFCLVAFWLVPALREVLSDRTPRRWPRPDLGFVKDAGIKRLLDFHVHLLVVFVPLASLGFSVMIWSGELVPKQVWGWTEITGAGLFVLATWATWRTLRGALPGLTEVHAVVAATLLTLGLYTLIDDGNVLLLTLALEGAALHLVARRFAGKTMATLGHVLFGGVAIALASRLLPYGGPDGQPVTNWRALTDLGVLAFGLAASFLSKSRKAALVYLGCLHVALLAWFWRELHMLPNGDGLVMLAWGAYGLLLHLVSRKAQSTLTSIAASIAAHLALEGALGLLAVRLATGYVGDRPIFNEKAVIDLVFMTLALTASFAVRSRNAAWIYRILMHLAALSWLWREAAPVDLDHGYVMLRWAAYLTMLAVISAHLSDRPTLKFVNFAYLGVGLLYLQHLAAGHEGDLIVLNTGTAVDLLVIVLALAASAAAQPVEVRGLYRLAVHAAVLGVLWREFAALQDPAAYAYLMLCWAGYALLLHLISRLVARRRGSDMFTEAVAHAIFAASGLWLLGRIVWGLYSVNPDAVAVFNPNGLADLGIIALAAGTFFLLSASRPRWVARAYGVWLHLAVLGWLWQELGLIPNGGNGYVTMAWGGYAVVLVVLSLRGSRSRVLLYCGIATLFAVAGKLFLIDLLYLDAIWRILLFLGFGGLFLVVSYYLQGVVKEAGTSGEVGQQEQAVGAE